MGGGGGGKREGEREREDSKTEIERKAEVARALVQSSLHNFVSFTFCLSPLRPLYMYFHVKQLNRCVSHTCMHNYTHTHTYGVEEE